MKLRSIRKSPLITNVWYRLLLFLNLGLAAFITFYTFFFIRAQDSAIPLRYSSLQGFELDQWYHVTSFVLFTLLVTGINSFMAHTLTTRTVGEGEQVLFPWISRLLFFNLFILLIVVAILRSIVRTL